jgi:hypothetical protein
MSDEMVGPSGGKPEGERRKPDVKLELADAYQAVFRGRPSDAQRDSVLVDLAAYSDYYTVSSIGSTIEHLAYKEGKRSVYGRIASMLNMTYEERHKLEQAARHEALVDQMEGYL